MIVCHCGPVSDTTIRAVIAAGAHTAEDVGEECGAGVQCGTCRPLIQRMLGDATHTTRTMQQVGPVGRGSGSTHG